MAGFPTSQGVSVAGFPTSQGVPVAGFPTSQGVPVAGFPTIIILYQGLFYGHYITHGGSSIIEVDTD